MKSTLKTVLRTVMSTSKTLSRKPCMNRESTNKVSHLFLKADFYKCVSVTKCCMRGCNTPKWL